MRWEYYANKYKEELKRTCHGNANASIQVTYFFVIAGDFCNIPYKYSNFIETFLVPLTF